MVHWEDLEGSVEREVEGGIGMGNTCKSMADSFQCMTKLTTIKKKKKKKKKRARWERKLINKRPQPRNHICVLCGLQCS